MQAASEALRVLDFVSCSPHLKARAALQCARAQVLLVTRPTYMWSHASLPPRVVDAKALLDADWPLRAVLNGERPAPGQPIEKEQVSEAPAAAEEETDGGKKGKAAKADSQRVSGRWARCLLVLTAHSAIEAQ